MKLNFLWLGLMVVAWGCVSPSSPDSCCPAPSSALPENKSAAGKPFAAKSVYEMTPAEIGQLVGQMRKSVPDLPKRVVALARRNLGQPYQLHLLGEFPFEDHDGQPLYCLENGDCVVFAEHIYAMALSYDWPSFFAMLQRLRYKGGEISAVTRNHYTLADWNENNAWMFRDITPEIAGNKTAIVTENINRTAFFKKSFQVEVSVPVQNYATTYVPAEFIKDVAAKLQNGDCVNLIRGKEGAGQYCGHVGMITISDDGTVNLLHSTQPKSVEQPLVAYVAEQMEKNKIRAQKGEVLFRGMKFLRLQEDPVANLLKIDGPDAPVVTGPKGLLKKAPRF